MTMAFNCLPYWHGSSTARQDSSQPLYKSVVMLHLTALQNYYSQHDANDSFCRVGHDGTEGKITCPDFDTVSKAYVGMWWIKYTKWADRSVLKCEGLRGVWTSSFRTQLILPVLGKQASWLVLTKCRINPNKPQYFKHHPLWLSADYLPSLTLVCYVLLTFWLPHFSF